MGRFNSKPPQMYDHPLWAASRVFTDAEAAALLPQVRACDPKAVEEMTTGFMRLGLTIAGQYVALFRSKRWVDDFVSAAMEGVVDAVQQLRDPHCGNDSPKSVVATCVHRCISESISDNQTIRVPGRTQRHHGRGIQPTRIHDDETNDSIIDSGLAPDINGVEDAIEQVVETELEADIVRLRVEGYNDTEIGEKLGYSQQTVQVIRQDLYDRLKAILPERTPCHE